MKSSSNHSGVTRVHLLILGQVQGVSFRYYARRQAASLGVAGWVRNLPDGRVEIVAEGPEEAVQQFVNWARRGPSEADVQHVEVRRLAPEGEAPPFRIRA